METIAEYRIVETIASTAFSTVHRAEREGESFILKVLKNAYPSASEIARFKREYEILRSIDCPGVVKPVAIINTSGIIAIVEEDFHAISLKDILAGAHAGLPFLLDIAHSVAETLGELHSRNIIHKDIKPANILVNPDTGVVRLADFGISAILSRQNEEIFRAEVIEGTLVYMSPEQTGRINRQIDYRTDLYSLGVTLYEMLTGRPPFVSSDPMEIIHAHIARSPVPAAAAAPAVPRVISDIIDRLLAKTAEERYQSAFGLAHDLDLCRAGLRPEGTIEPFELGASDVSARFNIPQMLVGRSTEVGALLTAFERFSGGTRELVLVTGHPGIGKSALVGEIHKPIVARRGFYIAGKYDQLRRDVPYSAIIQAFQLLVRQILAENQERIARWRDELTAALGINGLLVADVIPDLVHIIGEQSPVDELGHDEAQNRFNHVFSAFVNVFAGADHPVVLFLDDLQWIDQPSLGLLTSLLVDSEVRHLFVIGAYRDNEVDGAHPLAAAIDSARKAGVTVTDIILGPLDEEDVTELLANFMRGSQLSQNMLAAQIQGKTHGNPFFVIQFVKSLYDRGLIENRPRSGWTWDLDKIGALEVTDNVVELMVQKISRLPMENITMLKTCACVGNRFDLEILAEAGGTTIDVVLNDLAPLIDEGLVAAHRDLYRFHHDRIQEAAYSLMNEGERAAMHRRIGRIVLEKTTEERIPDKVFYIVHHLNKALHLVAGETERVRIAQLNLIAARRAKESSAFATALTYFRTGAGLLAAGDWERSYDMAFALTLGLAECNYITGDHEVTQGMFADILGRCRGSIDRARVYRLWILLLTRLSRYEEAVAKAVEGIRMFGIRLSPKPSPLPILIQVIRIKGLLRGDGIDRLLALPTHNDAETNAMVDLFESMTQATAYTSKNLRVLCTLRYFRIVADHGHHEHSASAFALAAVVFFAGLSDFATGRRLTEAAFTLLDASRTTDEGLTQFIAAYYCIFWYRHARESLESFRTMYRTFLDRGNFEMACHVVNNIADNSFILGRPIGEILEEYRKYVDFMKRQNEFFSQYCDDTIRRFEAMLGMTDAPGCLDRADGYEAARDASISAVNKLDRFIYYYQKMKLRYLHGDIPGALAAAAVADPCREEMLGTIHYMEFFFYHALTALAAGDTASLAGRRRLSGIARSARTRFRKWAVASPANFGHKLHLIEAEMQRRAGHDDRAVEAYNRAVDAAAENDYISDVALAHERCGLHHLARGRRETAAAHLAKAQYYYGRWGAAAKAAQLAAEHHTLVTAGFPQGERIPERGTGDTSTYAGLTVSTTASTQSFDLGSALKATQAISGEIVLARLLEKMIAIVMENAGAQKCMLIIEKNDILLVEAHGTVAGETTVLESTPVDDRKDLAASIVHYVARTRKNVIVRDAATDETFSTDPYVRANAVKSILCSPIVNQGRLSAILYLENNLVANAFTPERLRLLAILSSQAAISIDNARLYANLEEKVEERTRELKSARDALWGEMRLAVKIQTVLLPEDPVMPGYEVCGHMEPAEQVGGDYYDIINGDGLDWVIIGDVSGHGVQSGLVMMMVQTCIQLVVRNNPSVKPTALLLAVNRAVMYNIGKLRENKYMTITAFQFNRDGHVIHAGLHQDLLVYRAADATIERIPTEGLWLGLDIFPRDVNRNGEFDLNPGDVLLLYTDGVTEAWRRGSVKDKRDADADMFGEERLADVLSASAREPVTAIRQAILDALNGFDCQDDVTIVVVRRQA